MAKRDEVKELLGSMPSSMLGYQVMRKMVERGLVKGQDPSDHIVWSDDAARLIGDDIKTILHEMFHN